MFQAVLVANRGEIALRILRSCRELGIPTVAVYSEADRDAPWLRLADQAYLLGPASPASSYLNMDRLLEAAQDSGAEAVHPGYGFLSENAEFARAVSDAGLTWIGPPPDAIVQMGDKLSARKAAEAAGVPLVPGTLEPTDDPATVLAFAQKHGFPVAIKAAFGGGGRGLKVVRDPAGLPTALEGARREAAAAFGRGEVYVERYLRRPRHLEIQVLADTHGNCLFLGERDCSTQRRHQKLIEEAPAPGLDPDVRAAMGEAAVRISKQVGYQGAGTVEFLFDEGEFYFLEMNTRLQVEHPVTEVVTGVDLVHWQLRVAAGQPLSFSQEDVIIRGHAIEARINAEDCAAGFAPAPGLITTWRPPSGPGVRVDAGVEAGFEIPRAYDSLIAKLIAYGADREETRRRMLRALDELVIEGVPTTADFHRLAFVHPDFVAGRVSTVSVETEWDLSSLPVATAATQAAGARLASRTLTVEVDGKRLEVALFEPEAGASSPRRRERRGVRSGKRTDGPAIEDLVAPMQGTIVKTVAHAGRAVAAGDLVLILEAMKMENHINAHRDGVLTALHVAAGDVVNAGDVLATISDVGAGPADPREGSPVEP
ncbi:MAG: acetyl-CoA carboxylase biotin carboxylase subunit [Actinomycetota bacterium]|nr:acetyl-CoA carboxylase biotin carboxylase subunit [Actinomycetota bacterium]